MMLKHYRKYIRANPLQGWAIQVAVLLVIVGVLISARPHSARSDPSWSLVMLCFAFTQPTFFLLTRLSEEGRRERPLPPSQVRAIGGLSLASSLCAIGALAVAVYCRWAGWPQDVRVDWLVASFIAAAVAALMACGVRRTWAGRWGLRLSGAWLLSLALYVCVMLLRRAAGHA